jgi:hypothetical protein
VLVNSAKKAKQKTTVQGKVTNDMKGEEMIFNTYKTQKAQSNVRYDTHGILTRKKI